MKRITKLFTALALALGLTTAASAAKTVTPVFLLNYTTGTVSGWTNQSQNGGGDLNKVTSGGISFASTGNGGGGNFKNAFAGSSSDTFQDGTYVDIFGVSHTSLIDEVKASLALPAGTDFTADVYNTGIYQGAKVNATGQLTGLDPAKKYVIYVGTGKAISNAANKRAAFKLAAADCGTIDSLQYVVTQGHNDGQDPTTAATTYTTFTTDQYVGPKTDSLMIVRFVGKPNSSGAFKFRMSYGDDTIYRDGINFIAAAEIDDAENYSATVDSNTNWSDITWSSEITDPSAAVLNLTVENNATITMDGTFAYKKINVTGDATFVAADSLYEDGCFSKNLLSGNFSATDTISFGAIKDGYKGQYVQSEKGIALYAQNHEVISINIGGGNETSSTSPAENLVSGSDYYGLYPVPGDSWNNISGQWQSGPKTVTLSSAKSFDGATTEERTSIKLSGTAKNTWRCSSITNPFLRGYLDDGGDGISVEVTGVPYTKYDVIVYVTSDSSSNKLRPIQINDTWYTYNASGELVESQGEHGYDGDVWGAGEVKTPAIGQDAMLITNVVGSTLTVHGYRPNSSGGRATVCAVQLISRGELASKDFTANIIDTTTWDDGEGAGLADQSGTWESGELNTITLTNTADEATFTLNGEITAASLKIVCPEGKTLYVEKDEDATLNIGGYNLTEAFGDVIFNFDPDLSKVDAGSCLVGIGYDYEGTIKSGFKYMGDNNALTMTTISSGRVVIGGGGELKGDLDVFGGAEVTVGGNYYSPDDDVRFAVSKGTLTIAEDAEISVTSICLVNSGDDTNNGIFNINGTLTVTSECGSDCYAPRASHKGILFGHYYGGSTVTVGSTGSLIGENTWIQLTYTATSSLTINGGTVKVLGLNIGSQNNTPVVVQNGGTLALKDGLVQQNRGIYTFDGGTIEAWGDELDWTPNTTAIGANGLTVAGTKVTFSGALTGNGDISVGATTTLGLGQSRPTNTFIFAGETDVIYTENIADDGVVYQLTLGSSSETPTYRVFAADGTEKTIEGGQYVPSVSGKVAWYDFTFTNTLTSVGANTATLTRDTTYGLPDSQTPYTSDGESIFTAIDGYMEPGYPEEWSAAVFAKVPKVPNAVVMAFGTLSKGSIALIAGNTNDNEIVLARTTGNSKYEVLASMKVPNAFTASHLYSFCKSENEIKIYLDDVLWSTYTSESAISFGNGFQLGSLHGNIGNTGFVQYGRGYFDAEVEENNSTVTALRMYKTILGPNAIKALAEEFHYEPMNGTSELTINGNLNWIGEEGSTDWTVTPFGEESYTTNAPLPGSAIAITVTGGSNITMNQYEHQNYEALTVKSSGGDYELDFITGDAGPVAPTITGLTTIQAKKVKVNYDALKFGNVVLTDDTELQFKFFGFPFDTYFADTTIPFTGSVTEGAGAQVTATDLPTEGVRTATFEQNPASSQYELKITVEDHPFVYNMGWTWNDEDVTAETVSNNTAQAIIVQSNLEWPIDRSGITVEAGTLTVTEVTQRAADVTVEADAVLDLNGNQAKEMALTLNGGKVTYGNTKLGEADQIKVLTLTADSEINTTVKGQIYAASYNTATTIALDTYTLTKTGTDILQVVNTDITGTGTIDIQEGEFYGSEDTRAATTTFKIADGATLHNRGGKTMTIAKIEGEGGTLNNEGTMPAFELSGTLTIANAGTFGTITNATGAVVNVGQKHNLTFAGAGTVNAVLTDAQIASEGPITIFTTVEGATTVGGTVVDKDGKPVPGSFTGGSFQVDHEAKIGTTYYLTLQDALNAGGDVVMLKDVAKEVTIPAGKTVNLDFNGCAITTTSRQAINNYGTLTIANGNITAQESAIVLWGNSTTTISGGAYTAIDNAVIAGNGNEGEGDVTLTITGGTFNGTIESAGYIACGIYVPNSGTYTISGGQFNITGGCGICARAGEIKVASAAEFNLGGETTPGKVGDSPRLVPCVAMYTDYEAAYPGHAETDYLKAQNNTLSTYTTQGWFGPDEEDYYTLGQISDAEAKVGDTYYLTLAGAFAAAQDDDEIVVQKDCTVAERIDIDPTKDITLDANGKTITIAEGIYAFVNGGATETTGEGTLTVTGNGTFYAPTADSTCFLWARRGNIVVESGSFSMDGTAQCVYADNGCKATINGGTFVNRTGSDVLNVHNSRSAVTDIQCFGGSYSRDPALGDDYLKGTFVAEGYVSTLNASTGLYDVTEQTGPVTPPTGGGSVEPVPGEEGVYVVQPDPSSKTVTITGGLKDTDTIRVTTPEDITVIGVPADQIEVKINGTVIPNGAFIGGDETGFSTELDPDATVTIGTEEIPVTPTAIESEEGTVAEGAVATKAIPGLTYTLMRGTEIGTYGTETAKETATSTTISLKDGTTKPADKAFYVIEVTK